MPIRANSLEEVGDILLTTFGEKRLVLLDNMFKNLMETTPEKTGTLLHNWRFKPGSNAGNYLVENDGTYRESPREPSDATYTRNWSEFTIYNNSPYIVKVNNGESGNEHNQNFIQRAMMMTVGTW